MARFQIISSSNPQTVRFEGAPIYNGAYLKPSYIEFREVSSPTPIEWEVGDYVDYSRTGFRYKLYTKPQIKKQARPNSYGGAFVYQNVQLFDRTKDFEICPFRDLVPGDNGIHFSTQPSISTFEDVGGIARRIEACLDDMYDDWEVRVVSSEDAEDADFMAMISEARDFTVSGVSILGALDKIYEIWPLCGWTYSIENGKNILTIGGANIASAKSESQEFMYGKGNGLINIKKTFSNANEIATRIYAYGSSRNMIPRYYNNITSIKDYDSVDIANLMLPISPVGASYPGWGITDGKSDANKAFIEDASAIATLGLRPTTVYFDGSGDTPEIYPSIENTTIGNLRDAMSPSAQYYPSSSWGANDRLDEVFAAGTYDDGVQGSSGEQFIKSVSDDAYSASDLLVDGATEPIATLTLDNEISGKVVLTNSISGTISVEYGNRKPMLFAKIRVVGTDNDKVSTTTISLKPRFMSQTVFRFEVPTLTFTSESISTVTVYFSVGLGDAIQSRESHSSETPRFQLEASGDLVLGVQKTIQKSFTIKLRQIGFNITVQSALGEGKTIAMRTGKCAGRSFEIESCAYNASEDTWSLKVARGEDASLGTLFPNTDFPIEVGDQFVLLGIAMPDVYITMASVRLLEKAQELLSYTSSLQPFFEPEIDAKFMIENSVVLREGQYMSLDDEDIVGGTSTILIDTLTINEGESSIPTYKVTLRERKKKTWTQSVTNTIEQRSTKSSNPTNNATSSSGITADQVRDMMFFEEDGNGNIKLKDIYNGLWAQGFVSAGGISQTGGGGGGGSDVTVLRTWSAYNAGDQYEALGSNLGMGLRNDISSLDSRVTAIEQAGTSSVSWGQEPADPGTVVDLNVNGTSKTLLKSNAIDYTEKVVGRISDDDAATILNTFFPIPNQANN